MRRRLTPEDRWAIVAYIRALQLSQNATQADVAAGQHVEPLASIAENEGLPTSFAKPWTLPLDRCLRHAERPDNVYCLDSSTSADPGSGAPAASQSTTANSPAAVRQPDKQHRSSNLGSFRTKA